MVTLAKSMRGRKALQRRVPAFRFCREYRFSPGYSQGICYILATLQTRCGRQVFNLNFISTERVLCARYPRVLNGFEWMASCNNCGQIIADGTVVCRFCGASLGSPYQATKQREYVPPMWATEPPPAPLQQRNPAASPFAGYRCPHCHSTYPPRVVKRISSEGWVVFALLLFFCFPLFWIGLLIKEEYRTCVACGATFG